MRRHALHPAARGERLVGLVEDHEALLRPDGSDDAVDDAVVEQVGGRVVGVGDVGQRRAVALDRRQHRLGIELEVRRQRHADEAQPAQLGRHLVHHETRQRRQHRGAGFHAGHRQQVDDLVAAVAQHQRAAVGQRHVMRQRLDQRRGGAARVAVDRSPCQARAQFLLQLGRQAERVFHRIQLHVAGTGLDGIAVHGLHVLADRGLQAWAVRSAFMRWVRPAVRGRRGRG